MASHNIRHLSRLWPRQSSLALCISKATSQTAITLLLPNKRVMQTSFRQSLPTGLGQRAVCWVSCSGLRNTRPHGGGIQRQSRPIRVNWVWVPRRQRSISRFPCRLFVRNKSCDLIVQTELRDCEASRSSVFSYLRGFTSKRKQCAEKVIIGGLHDTVLIRVLPPAFTRVTRVAGAKLGVDFH